MAKTTVETKETREPVPFAETHFETTIKSGDTKVTGSSFNRQESIDRAWNKAANAQKK